MQFLVLRNHVVNSKFNASSFSQVVISPMCSLHDIKGSLCQHIWLGSYVAICTVHQLIFIALHMITLIVTVTILLVDKQKCIFHLTVAINNEMLMVSKRMHLDHIPTTLQ